MASNYFVAGPKPKKKTVAQVKKEAKSKKPPHKRKPKPAPNAWNVFY